MCQPDDSKSAIHSFPVSSEIDLGKLRAVPLDDFVQLELIKELRRGDDPYIMTVEGFEPGQGSTRVRFTHK